MQLSAKALLKPFSALAKDADDCSNDDDEGSLEVIFEDHEDSKSDVEDNEDGDDKEDEDEDEEDPLDVLDEEDRNKLLEDTLAVCTMLNKVCIDISSFLSPYSHLISLDSKIIFCNHPFNYSCSSCMAQDLCYS